MNTIKKIVLSVAAFAAMGGLLSLALPPALVAANPYVSPVVAVAKGPQICAAAGDPCSTFVTKYIDPFIKLLTAVVGVGAAISIVMAGIQYASSADDPSKVSKAKNRIIQTIIGLIAYLFLFSFLNYIIPGGLI